MAAITRSAAVDEAGAGDIRGALGTISLDDTAPRAGLSAKLKTLPRHRGPRADRDVPATTTPARSPRTGRPGRTTAPGCCGLSCCWSRAVRQPGDGAAPRRGHRGGARAAAHRAVRALLGRAHGRLPAHPQRAYPRHPSSSGSTMAAGYLGVPQLVAGAAGGGRDPGRRGHRQLPPVRADRPVALCAARSFSSRSTWSAPVRRVDGPRDFTEAGPARRLRAAGHGHAADQSASSAPRWRRGSCSSSSPTWSESGITPRFIRYEKVDLWIGI